MANNTAKLREALCEIVLLCRKVGLSIHGDVACGIIASKARAALAAPPRNCDVGTAEEQICRHVQESGLECNLETPCHSRAMECRKCFAKWAQKPYEEGGAK